MNGRVQVPLFLLIWVVVGLIVAVNKNYGHHLNTASKIGTFVLGVLLWPVLAAGGSVGLTF
jgi:hypothetical protein